MAVPPTESPGLTRRALLRGGLVALAWGCAGNPPEVSGARAAAADPFRAVGDLLVTLDGAGPAPRGRDRIGLAVVPGGGINLVALGQGVFLVWEGLLQLHPRAFRYVIAQILAHEVAHDHLGHAGSGPPAAIVTEMGLAIFGAQVPRERYAPGGDRPIVVRAFSPDQERAADAAAVAILSRIAAYGFPYWGPREGMVRMLRYLRDKFGAEGGGLFAVHPDPDARIRHIEASRDPFG